MPFDTSDLHDPHRIVIARDERQRRNIILDEPFLASVRRNGIIEPVIVERETWRLIAGERRTMAARATGAQIPIRWFDTLAPSERERVELEENVKRQDLHWRDQVSAYARLHKILSDEHGTEWNVTRSAEELGIGVVTLYNHLRVFANLQSPRLADCTGFEQAIGILQRFAERKASAIVAEITAQGTRLFSLTPPNATGAPNGHDASISNNPGNGTTLDLSPPHTEEGGSATVDGSPGLPWLEGDRSGGDSLPAGGPPTSPLPAPAPAFPVFTPAAPIVVASFLDWAPTYAGEPFSFIHCDFPYGVNTADSLIESYDNNPRIYWDLLDALIAATPRLFSYSSHLMFWLSQRQDFFEPTKQKLRAAGFHVIDNMLIWLKSDSRGAAPGVKGTHPRHIYESALLCSRGQRPLVKQFGDGYVAPSVSKPIHPTQKPEPMLRHFFAGLVDETTTFFDPTVGSGASLRAANDLGARSAYGLELDPGYAAAANATTVRALNLQELSKS